MRELGPLVALGAAVLTSSACGAFLSHTLEHVPGHPEARYDRTYAEKAWTPADVGRAIDLEEADDGAPCFAAALERLHVVIIDHDMTPQETARFLVGEDVTEGTGDADVTTAKSGAIDVERSRVILAVQRPDDSQRSLASSALLHELEHLRLWCETGDPDDNHSDPPGPWTVATDARIARLAS
ncbi:MAG: hypothetical protein WCO19_01860, partial [Candidatus Saccharibacteria bacterium]